jgi:uncharacterized oligopeptide transporter (OPT) family protein
MYLPFETTFAIFVGGAFRSIGDWVAKRRGFNEAQQARVENAGVLTASGLIAGESLLGLLWAALVALALSQQTWLQGAAAIAKRVTSWQLFEHPLYVIGLVVMALLALLMVASPLTAAGDPKEPAPPKSIM